MRTWKVIMAVAVIFAAGVFAGELLEAFQDRHKGRGESRHVPPEKFWVEKQRDFLGRMERHLDLRADQRQKIARILAESQERSKAMWDSISPQMKEEFRRVHEEILEELDPEQQEKFKEMTTRRHHREKDKGKHWEGKDGELEGRRKGMEGGC